MDSLGDKEPRERIRPYGSSLKSPRVIGGFVEKDYKILKPYQKMKLRMIMLLTKNT